MTVAAIIDTQSSFEAVGYEVMSGDKQLAADASLLSEQLHRMRQRQGPSNDQRQLRSFSSGEAARMIGVSDGYLRQLSLSGDGPQPSTVTPTGRRFYSLDDVNALRRYLAGQGGNRAVRYVPHRNPKDGEHLQVLAVTNFTGRSGKTTTVTHLAQYLALKGYRVLAVDLDPQGCMSALFGYEPELDLTPNASIWEAIRFDNNRMPLSSIIRQTHFPCLHLVPGNIELLAFEHEAPHHMSDRDQDDRRVGEDLFFTRLQEAIASVADNYDVVVLDCSPQLGFLTLSALCAATSVIVPLHPRMVDVASMCQFLSMASDLLTPVRDAGRTLNINFLRYLITRYEPNDGEETQIVAFLRAQLGQRVFTSPMINASAISDVSPLKRTLYEAGREGVSRANYDRAMEALIAVNSEIEALIRASWGRTDR